MSVKIYVVMADEVPSYHPWLVASFTDESQTELFKTRIEQEVKNNKHQDEWKNKYDSKTFRYHKGHYQFWIEEVVLYAHLDQFLEEHNI